MRFVLTHIPRTGGTSLFAGIRAQLPGAPAAEFDSYADIALLSDHELNSFQVISTYLGSRLFRRLSGSWTKILLLRDPLARLRSSYWHLRTTPENFSFASAKAKAGGFREYLASRDAAVLFQATNTQAWTVLGDKSPHFRASWAGRAEADLAQQAEEQLTAYDFVGFTETLPDFWAGLCAHHGWKADPLPRLRANPPIEMAEEPDPEDLRFHTALDERLVQFARRRYGPKN